MQDLRDRFDQEAFSVGLEQLDSAIGASQDLMSFAPIILVASGGFASLTALGNRTSTQDLDFFIDPVGYGQHKDKVQRALKEAIANVGLSLHYDPKWCNDDVTLFLSLLNDPKDLFDRSLEQETVLYRGQNLLIYAVLWKWVLVRKMKRLQMEGQGQRPEDLSDCVAILKLLTTNGSSPLERAELGEFDHTKREPPVFDTTVDQVGELFIQLGGARPFTR